MTLSDFSQLKQQVVRTIVNSDSHSHLLQSLKEVFRESINSVRRFEKISTIGQLLNVLELRGLLSEDNVEPLKDIARKTDSSELLHKVNKYEDSHVPRDYGNYYGVSEKGNKTLLSETINSSPFESGMSKRKKDRMTRTVVEEIGSFWRDLARSLKIRECKIDEIDHNHRTLATKALKMMELFEERADQKK
ncbi:Fadd, partial [Operophtera brumata]